MLMVGQWTEPAMGFKPAVGEPNERRPAVSYGVRGYKSKKALKEAVAQRGADQIQVFGTSLFGDEQADNVAQLADNPRAVIVGPDVYNDRRWYATVKTRKDGTIYVS